jgi:hypothetical protein
MDWQPISTAPEDGTKVLVLYMGDVHVAEFGPVWHPSDKRWKVRAPSRDPQNINTAVIGPDIGPDGKLQLWGDAGPTHWMPLPPTDGGNNEG